MSKLYTEEEIRKFFNSPIEEELTVDELISKLTPIELPTDEDIENNAYSDRRVDDWEHEQQIGFERGAKWMRDKIKGGQDNE